MLLDHQADIDGVYNRLGNNQGQPTPTQNLEVQL